MERKGRGRKGKEGEEKMRIVLREKNNKCYSVVEFTYQIIHKEEGINNPFIDVYLAGDIVTPNEVEELKGIGVTVEIV
jgi:hypothetical protein